MSRNRSGLIMKVHPDFKRLMDSMSKSERTTRAELTRLIARDDRFISKFKKRSDKFEEETIFG